MKIKFDYIECHTAKATLFVRDSAFAWLPKSCYKITNTSTNELEVIEGFEVVWKNDEGKIVLKEGEASVGSNVSGSSIRLIHITENNIDELWEYI